MAQNSNIEWTHHTANLWWGCVEVHEGCDNCYAREWANKWRKGLWGNKTPRGIIKSFYKDLNRFQNQAKKLGVIHRVFIGSMMDIFEKPMPLVSYEGNPLSFDTGHLRDQLFEKISAGEYNNLLFLFLTKRPGNINKYIPASWKLAPPSNVMYGTSPVSQATADKLIPQLVAVNGRRFLSMEPQLEEVSISKHISGIDWVIQGGESGLKRRPFNLDWARKIKKECSDASVPYFFKQIDKVEPIPEDMLIREFP